MDEMLKIDRLQVDMSLAQIAKGHWSLLKIESATDNGWHFKKYKAKKVIYTFPEIPKDNGWIVINR